MNPSKHSLILVGILVLASALMLFRLETKSYWGDEIFSVTHAQRDSFVILSGEGEPGNPPLYFLLLHFWLIFGTGEFAVRFLSVIFGLLSVYMTYKVGSLFFSQKEGLISAFLLSIAHGFIGQAQDARMYTLVTFLALCSLYFFYRAAKEGKDSYLLAYLFSTFLALCTHYFSFFVVLVELLYFVAERRSHTLSAKKFFIVICVIFLFYLPFLIPFIGNAFERVKRNIEEESIVRAADLWGYQPDTMFIATLSAYSNTKYAIPLFLLPLLYGLIINWKKERNQYLLLLLWILVPVFVVFLLCFKMFLGLKYILLTMPIFLVLVAHGVTSFKNKRIWVLLLLLITASASIKLMEYYASEKPDWRSTASYVDSVARSDLVVVQPHWARKYFWFYSRLDRQQIIGVTEEDGLPSKTQAVYANNSRMLVVYSDENKMFDYGGNVRGWLDETCVKNREFAEITVYSCS